MKKLLFLSFFPLAVISANEVQAVTVNASNVTIQGGSNSSVIWRAPLSKTYKVFVLVGRNSTATNALYHVYPNGKSATSTSCLSTDAYFPCFEIPVNQALNAGRLVQLTLNNDVKTTWNFFENTGYVSVESSNLSATEILDVGSVQFTPLAAPDFKTIMRARWKDAIASTAALKSAITQCVTYNQGIGTLCDQIVTTELYKYGISAMPSPKNENVQVATVSITASTTATILPHIQIAGYSNPLAGCTFQLVPTITWNTSANFKISWDIKATAFTAPATSTAFCTNFVPYSTPL